MKRTTMLLAVVAVLFMGLADSAQARHSRGGHRSWGWGVGYGMGYGMGPWWGWGSGWYGPPRSVPGVGPDLAVVDTDIDPEHALVFLDGKLIGTADDFDGFPDYLYLESGTYTLEFKLGGYESQTVEVKARPGRYFPFDMKLERAVGEKKAPWYDRPEKLPVGRVFGPATPDQPAERSGADPSLRPETRDVQVEKVERENAKPVAALELRVTPGNAAVYLDGELVGTGDELSRLERGIAVTPGNHKIEVFAPGRVAKVIEVEAKEGERNQVVVELEQGS